jgi:hypothetical protein
MPSTTTMEMSDTTMITMAVTKVVVATGMSRMMIITVRIFLLHHRFFFRMLEGRHSVVQRRFRPFIPSNTHGKLPPWLTLGNQAKTIRRAATRTHVPIQLTPRAFGLAKAAYAVGETLDLLSIGRTSLYAAVKRGDLKCVKFGKKTLFYAADLASFLTRLRRMNEAKADRVGRTLSSSKSFERS